jgi:hypothetical protein
MEYLNRLRGQRTYLAGPIDRCPTGGQTWREAITPFLIDLGVVILNPLNKPTEIAKEDIESRKARKALKASGDFDGMRAAMKPIRNVDLRMVDISDFLIVHLDLEVYPCGTIEEIALANRQKKPIILHMQQGKKEVPDWLFAMFHHSTMFSNWDEVRTYLLSIDSGENKNTDRWYFFNI